MLLSILLLFVHVNTVLDYLLSINCFSAAWINSCQWLGRLGHRCDLSQVSWFRFRLWCLGLVIVELFLKLVYFVEIGQDLCRSIGWHNTLDKFGFLLDVCCLGRVESFKLCKGSVRITFLFELYEAAELSSYRLRMWWIRICMRNLTISWATWLR